MALLNYAKREVNAKIVYYGPGLCGKTTNIKFIHQKLRPDTCGKLLSLATETDRTLFFDFLPVELGEVKGFKTRFHLYTVPGQVFYNSTRQMVLKGADGVVFVADSQRSMLENNLESLRNLRDNLEEQGRKLEDIPLVIQCNKRDLPDILSLEELSQALNPRRVPIFAAAAVRGDGVVQTLTSVCKMVLHKLQQSAASAGRQPESEKTMAASYRALRKDADRIGGAPAAEIIPPPPPLPPLAIEGCGEPQKLGDERVLLPLRLKLRGQEALYRLEMRLELDHDAPMAKVESFQKVTT